MIIHLSKSEHGAVVSLEVGENINTPSVTEGKDGYYTRFYAFGSTRNIVQEYKGANVNNLVNKRLTLDPKKYPNGYKDIRPNLQQGEIFSKILQFDDIYPSSELSISDVRFRLMWRIDSETNDKIQIGTDENGDPIYDQYAIWYFQIPEFNFENSTYDEEKNPNGMLIPNKVPSVHFQSGALQGMEFELIYHDESKTITSDDGISFEVKKGDFEIKYKEEEGNYIIPAITGLIPSENDDIILFNVKMPEEYTDSAYIRLETAMNEEIERLSSDQNNYQFSSNPVVFNENNPDLSIGRKVEYINTGYSYVTRVISLTTKLDYPCEQTITIGNNLIKGNTQELKEEVASANKNIDLISAINNMTASLQQSYQRTVKQMQEGFARINDMWKFDTELENTIYSKFNVYSQGGISALGVWRGEGGGGGEGGLIKLVHGFDDLGGVFDNTTMTETFNAYTINEIWKLANAGASTIGTGNVVTAVSKTALGIVVTKGITLYDWVRQPNKPTYSLSEINNVSGTYTGLTVGKAQTADRLSAARTIWGQSFDGANNVTGALSGATTITASSTIKGYRLQSTCATGTAPLLVSSTTKVGNLNADLLDSYHESAFRMGYGHDGVKYRHAAYGDGNLQWRKIVTYVNTSGGIWQGCAVIGNLWLELGNTSAQEVVEIPFQAIFTAYYGDSAVYQNKSELYLPGYCVWDVIRIVRYGNNSWEVQVRVPVANYRLSFEYTVKNINNGGTVTAGQFSTSVKTSTVANDHDTNVTRPNSDKAYRLAKTVYLWGQPFDGTGNVNGDLTSTGNISAQGSVTALTTSDKRLKRDFDYTLSYTDRLLAMGRVCDFRYTEKARKRNKGGVDGEAHTGLLYQKVKEVLPSMAYETEDGYGALNYLSPDYINTIAGATQETARLVKALMGDIERLKKELSELKGKGGE